MIDIANEALAQVTIIPESSAEASDIVSINLATHDRIVAALTEGKSSKQVREICRSVKRGFERAAKNYQKALARHRARPTSESVAKVSRARRVRAPDHLASHASAPRTKGSRSVRAPGCNDGSGDSDGGDGSGGHGDGADVLRRALFAYNTRFWRDPRCRWVLWPEYFSHPDGVPNYALVRDISRLWREALEANFYRHQHQVDRRLRYRVRRALRACFRDVGCDPRNVQWSPPGLWPQRDFRKAPYDDGIYGFINVGADE